MLVFRNCFYNFNFKMNRLGFVFLLLLSAIQMQPLLVLSAESTEILESTIRTCYSYLTMDNDEMSRMRTSYKNGDSEAGIYVESLLKQCNAEIASGTLYTVVNKAVLPPSGDKHDYMSMAPYWWPDETQPGGLPYKYRDGMINPETRKANTDQDALKGAFASIYNNGLAFYFTGDEKYRRRAIEVINTFFIDKETRMNPNLNYSQFRCGHNNNFGAPAGIIIIANIYELLQGVALLSADAGLPDYTSHGLKEWMKKYLDWMLNSKLGTAERNTKNNHGTHYDCQIIAIMLYLDDVDGVRKYIQTITMPRLARQVAKDGSQPEELKRTKSWNYTNMNMQGFFNIALMAEKIDVDLWHYSRDGQILLKSMIDWFIPYLKLEKEWSWKQIEKQQVSRIEWCFEVAAKEYGDTRYTDIISGFKSIHKNILAK